MVGSVLDLKFLNCWNFRFFSFLIFFVILVVWNIPKNQDHGWFSFAIDFELKVQVSDTERNRRSSTFGEPRCRAPVFTYIGPLLNMLGI